MHLSLSLMMGARHGGAFGYNPITVLGDDLLEWWEAGQGMTLVGSAVSAWEGRKNGYTVSQATSASRPIYSATSFGGAPGLTFDGTDDCLEAADVFSLATGSTGAEMWAVVEQDALVADTGTRVVFAYGGAAGTGRRDLRRIVVTGVNRAQSVIGDGSTVFGPANGTIDFSSRHVLRAAIGATSSTMHVDANTGATVSGVPATGTDRARIGANTAATAATFHQGQIRDIIITNPLTTDQASALESFLLARRAL